MVTVPELVQAAADVHRRTGTRSAVVRCAPDVGYEIGSPVSFPGSYDPRPGALGMAMEIDQYLPRGVWRLCDAEQTLLYDCREDRHV